MFTLRKLVFIVLVTLVLLAAGRFAYQMMSSQRVSGTVRDAASRAPLVGVTVSASGIRTTTNANGEYALDFERGPWTFDAGLDGYLPGQFSGTNEDWLSRDVRFDFELTPNRVVGYVIDAETNKPLADVPVRAGEQVIRANAQGAFELHGVKLGTPIAAELLGYQPGTLTFGGEPALNIPLAPTLVTVTVMSTASKPIANAQVAAGDLSSTTDTQGRAVLRRVEPGTTVKVTAVGFDPASAPVPAQSDPLTPTLQLTLRPNVLDGVITDAATGKPIAGALVYLGNAYSRVNAQGAYHLENLPDKVTLTLMAPGYRKTQVTVSGEARHDIKLQPFLVRGIHLPFGMLPDRVRAAFDMVKKTDLNAIVLDVKAEKGYISWDSKLPLAKQISAPYLKGIDLQEVIQRCRAESVYCIARIPVFQDTLLATKRPDLGLHFPNGIVYTDNNESAWTNAANSTVWDYNIGLAKEVAAMGFDEIQFDYVRFPGHVNGLYTGVISTEQGRIGAIAGFLARAEKELRPLGVFISADVFGLTTAVDDEQYTGQRLSVLGPYVDFLSPMVYPDVWTQAGYLLTNGLKIKNCTEAVRCPYDVIFNSYKRATEKTTTKVRLWLQAYAGRGNYGVAEYRIQRKAADEAGSVGWMFWSGIGSYDPSMFGPPE